LVDHHLRIGRLFSSQLIDSVQESVNFFLYLPIKTKNGYFFPKEGEQTFCLPFEPLGVLLNPESDDQASLWLCMLLVGALMQQTWLKQHKISPLQGKILALYDMAGSIVKKDVHLPIGMKVLELHVQPPLLVVKDIEYRIINPVYCDDQGWVEK
jgi:hypothetical protein